MLIPPVAGLAVADGRAAAVDRFWKAASRGAVAGMGFHLAFVGLFAALGVPTLAAVNIASTAAWGAILLCIRRRWYLVALPLAAAELVGHAVAASWELGWDTGFHLYVLLLVLLALHAPHGLTHRLVVATATATAYTAADLGLAAHHAVVHLAGAAEVGLRLMNLAGFFALVVLLSLVHATAVGNAEAQLRVHAERDPLTGLYNRRSLLRRVAALQEAGAQRSAWVVFVDIDHFKAVNDRHGHAAGDEAIRFVADRILRTVRHDDLVARWGGEEFLALLLDVDQEGALALAERIRAGVHGGSRSPDTSCHPLTVTIGIGEHRWPEPLDAALGRADAALYAGKGAGRDRVQLAAAPAA